MNNNYSALLQLLNNFIREEPLTVSEDTDWESLLQFARIHSVDGIVSYMVLQHGSFGIRPEVYDAMTQRCLDSISFYAFRYEQMKYISELLSEAGIDHLLFKGIVLRQIYPVPELRSFGDIDILICREDREKTDHFMKDLGFSIKNDWEPVYSYYKKDSVYEIHTELLDSNISDRIDCRVYFRNTMWDNAVQTGPHTCVFTREYHLLYLLAHIAKHIKGSGAGIRMYLDIALYLKKYGRELDWTWIGKQLEMTKMSTFAGTVFDFVKVCFHIDSPMAADVPDAGKMADIFEFTLDAGTFGFTNRDRGAVAVAHKQVKNGTVGKIGVVLGKMFPSAKILAPRYTYLQKHPGLIPIAWVHRFIITRGTAIRHLQDADKIIHADQNEADGLMHIYDVFHL